MGRIRYGTCMRPNIGVSLACLLILGTLLLSLAFLVNILLLRLQHRPVYLVGR